MEQLALLTLIRQELSTEQNTVDLDLIFSQSDIVNVILQILGEPVGSETLKYLKLEAGWILSNLAYGSEE